MYCLTMIILFLNKISDFFYDLYIEVYGWAWPLNLVARYFYFVSRDLLVIVEYSTDFANWIGNVKDRIENLLSWDDIMALLQTWLDYATWAWSWIADAANNVWDIVEQWWLTKKWQIEDWIAAATEGLDDLKVAWSTFWTVTFPTLVSFTWLGIWWDSKLPDIQGLIETAVRDFVPLLEGWLDWKDKVTEFFADPLQWLYIKMDEWFERFW